MSWPPTSHTVKLMFLYSTVSTLKPEEDRKEIRADQTLTVMTNTHKAVVEGSRSNQEQISVVRLLPMVGMVVTISPSFSLYKIVVFPAASKPTGEGKGTIKHTSKRLAPRLKSIFKSQYSAESSKERTDNGTAGFR